MATIEIKPHTGTQRVGNEFVHDVDTGIDAIFVVSKEYPVPRRVGFVGRTAGSVATFITPVSESDKATILAAVAQFQQADAATSVDAQPLEK